MGFLLKRDENMSNQIDTIEKRIKFARYARDISQDLLAKKCGYKYQGSISQMESGSYNFTPAVIEKLANALEVTSVWLETGLNPPAGFPSIDGEEDRLQPTNSLVFSNGKDLNQPIDYQISDVQILRNDLKFQAEKILLLEGKISFLEQRISALETAVRGR